MKRKGIIIVIICLQVLIIAGMIAKSMYPLINGKEIELLVQPRDPRDIFRGDYVVLSYNFSRIDLDSIANDLPKKHNYHYGDILYLELIQNGKYYMPIALWQNPPKDKFFMRVITQNYGYGNIIYLNGGIESFYTDSKSAKKLEEMTQRQPNNQDEEENEKKIKLSVTVMVAPTGEARIKKVNYPF